MTNREETITTKYYSDFFIKALVAQMGEQRTENPSVGGSILP